MNAREMALLLAVLEAELEAEAGAGESDDPACAWCGEVVPDGLSADAPYCSAACREDAALDDHIARMAAAGETPEDDDGD